MKRQHWYAVAVALLSVSACGSPSAAPSDAGEATLTASPTVTYAVSGYTFPALTVAAGARVAVTDGDDEPHTVTADDGSFDSGSFDAANPGSFTAPSKPGRYAITCSVHPSMHGTVVVR